MKTSGFIKILRNPLSYLFLILILGLFLRIYKSVDFLPHGHDQDLEGWVIKDILFNKHLRLIGQETSTKGVFIGGLFYYLLLPFYVIFGMQPLGGIAFSVILGLITIGSFYYVFSKLFDKKVGFIAAFVYGVSFYTVFNDREVVPTAPAMLWSIWLLYAVLDPLSKKGKVNFILIGLLGGLIWHVNLSLFIVMALVPVSIFLSKRKVDKRGLLKGIAVFLLVNLPLILFELRHGFIQIKSIAESFLVKQGAIQTGIERFFWVLYVANKNATRLLWGQFPNIPYYLAGLTLLGLFIFLIKKKLLSKNQSIVMFLWVLIYLLFFSIYPKNLSEYYLNPLTIIWIGIISLSLSYFLKAKKFVFWTLILTIALLNLYWFREFRSDGAGYLQKSSLIKEIRADMARHSYPCASVSYITTPGNNFGYRYLFWLDKMHINKPASGAPPYTIVFPLSMVDRVDKTFGALGLIYPDYEKYDRNQLKTLCSKENENEVDSMFLYSQ